MAATEGNLGSLTGTVMGEFESPKAGPGAGLPNRLRGAANAFHLGPVHHNHSKIGKAAPFKKGGRGATEIHVHTNIDGREAAHTIAHHFARDSEHSRQAPFFDGYSTYSGPDRQTSTG